MQPPITDWRPYTQFEIRQSIRTYHWIGVPLLILLGIASSLFLPMMPQTVYELLTKGFQLKNWTEVIVFNDFFSLFVFPFWFGIFDLLRVYIQPVEERYLDVFLSKPVSRKRYLLTKLIPSFIIVFALIVLMIPIYMAKIFWLNDGTQFNVAGFAAGALFTAALTLFLLAIANFLFLFLKEVYHAILVAFGLWLVPILPTALLVYRPDQLQTKPWLKPMLYPANLLWYTPQGSGLFTLIGLLFLCVSMVLMWSAARRMKRMDLC